MFEPHQFDSQIEVTSSKCNDINMFKVAPTNKKFDAIKLKANFVNS